jgi:3-oxoadipate CoA-transferase alpha subunit
MIDKRIASAREAVADIFDGATVMIGGFGEAGSPIELIHALIDQGAKDLTVVSNNTGTGLVGLAALLRAERVRKVVYRAGKVELELVPQGTLAERIRAGGAGVAAFYTPTAAGTPLADGKETRVFNGREHVLEHGLRADFTLIKGRAADTHGNVLYHRTARNFAPMMATAATVSIVQAAEVVAAGALDPETIVTPGIFIDRVVHVPSPALESALNEAGASYP